MLVPTQDWPNGLHFVLRRLNAAGHETVLVGGSVRDLLMSRPIHDWDVATAATPEQVASLFARSVPTGLRHGTLTVLVDDLAIEITTFRTEGTYSDGRRPDSVQFTTDLRQDLQRRDFTMNAMAARPDGTLVDPLGGLQDLQLRQIRAVGKAADRFAEDGLRILRGLRLAAVLACNVEQHTLAAMKAESSRLHCIARERIGVEVGRLFSACHAHSLLTFATGPWLGQLSQPWPMAGEGLVRVANRIIPTLAETPLPVSLGNEVDRDDWRQIAVFAAVVWQSGWSPEVAAQASRGMAWPRRFQSTALAVSKLLHTDAAMWSDPTWQIRLFEDGPMPVYTACVIYDAWTARTPTARQGLWAAAVKQMPLANRHDLQITGRDILQLQVSGPTIGKVKAMLIEEVLTGKVANLATDLRARARQIIDKLGENLGENLREPGDVL